jgi:hypothetical protein
MNVVVITTTSRPDIPSAKNSDACLTAPGRTPNVANLPNQAIAIGWASIAEPLQCRRGPNSDESRHFITTWHGIAFR